MRLYEPAHLTATILAGVATGFYLSHTLVLGPLFSWLAEPARVPLLQQTYSEFRVLHPPVLYLGVITVQQAAALVFAAIAVSMKRHAPAAIAAAACALVVPAVHVLTGFFALEVGVVSGAVQDAPRLARFAAWNVPIHVFHTAATLAAFVLLCRIPPEASTS